MNKKRAVILIALAFFASATAFADGRGKAIRECKSSIRDNYDVGNFRDVFAERNGHHRWRVYGKVGQRGYGYPFHCSVKRGRVRSYHYEGPYGDWDNGWGNDGYRDKRQKKRDRNVAIGVGLAALAAVAIASSSNNKGSRADNDFSYDKDIDKRYLEDECGESLGGRVRREHHGVRNLEMDYGRAEHSGSKLSGNGLIHWQQRKPSDIEFTCHFDRDGRVVDSSYSFY